jgi:MarR family 2-MHQ and catechol resistance regulon transcriptional repressor
MPTKYNGTEEEKLILNAYISFLRAYNSVMERLSDLLLKNRLTASQFGVLEALYFLGPMNQKTVSKKILKSASNICTVLENLEKRGLIQRETYTKDKRNTLVSLTPKGEKLIKELFPLHLEDIKKEFSVLNKKEIETFYKLCKKLGLRELA